MSTFRRTLQHILCTGGTELGKWHSFGDRANDADLHCRSTQAAETIPLRCTLVDRIGKLCGVAPSGEEVLKKPWGIGT